MKTQKFYPFSLIHNAKKISLFSCLWLLIFSASAQHVTITPNGITPATSSSYPRLNYDAIIALPNPAVGDIAYDLTFLCLRVFNGTAWNAILQQNSLSGNNAEMSIIATSGGPQYESAADVALDKNSNIYITGTFSGTVNFGSISISAHTISGSDAFIIKYNKYGVVQWAQAIGGTGNATGTSIAVDDSSNVYISGGFLGSINFGTISGSSSGGQDAFIAKYNAAGVNQWARSMGGSTGHDLGQGITVDKNCNVYMTGYFAGTGIFGNNIFNSRGGNDIFLLKYNSSGVLQWARDGGGTGSDMGVGVAIDANENVFLTGNYEGTSTFGSFSTTSIGNSDIFIVKYNKDGVAQWAVSGGSTSEDGVTDILVDHLNYIAISGFTNGTCYFGFYTINNKGVADIFLAKYTNDGVPFFAKGIGTQEYDTASGICADNTGNIYLTGTFSRTATVDGISINLPGTKDMLITKYDFDGNIKWVKSAVGLNLAYGKSIAVDSNNNIFAVGEFNDGISDGKTTIRINDNTDFVLMRLSN